MRQVNAALRRIPEWWLWLAGALPLALLIHDAFGGLLGVDPVREIEHRLGRTGFYFLIATLAVTPLRRRVGLNLIHLRRALGLLSFSYVLLHLLAWAVFDMGLLWRQMLGDVARRPYLLFGMSAFAILLILAMTSNRFSIRRLGRWWSRLHRLVYIAAVLASLHWIWALKLLPGWVIFCLGLMGLTLLSRFLPTRRTP
ncbi:MAG: protein-methionine-sulfoxide reductase heme-binding subunit MsrQ [Paracoccus sp. (in: a-proteobacteria)]|nr:protein-methionine-sulfoxide reductase heme-binding subunit MsrQ [Paracoccus sp. (in: a-proteobacteria)]